MAGFDVVIPLSGAYQYLGQTRKAAGRLRTVTETAPAITFPAESDQPPEDETINFDHVSFQYGGIPPLVLQDISFTIPSGRRIAIMGATGSGKSTLLYLLSRFEDPTQGQIRLGQCDLSRFSETALREYICIVDQRSHIFNGSLRDNLLLVDPEADDDRLEEALAVVRLMELVKGLPEGLDTWVGESGRMLSGGQARRLAVARATLSKAPIWAFDEPTEGLDTKTAKSMMNNLMKAGKDRTIIMITHRPEALENMDQVLLMEAGRMASASSPQHLKAQSPLYRRLISTI
jgi:ATP-binding cassette subfamily C protein CydC